MSGGKSTSRSTLLSGPSAPRATLPKTRRFVTSWGCGRRDQVSPLSPDLPPYRAGQPAQLRGLMLDIDHEVASGRIDQLTVEEFKVPARAAIEDRTDLVHALAQGDCEGPASWSCARLP